MSDITRSSRPVPTTARRTSPPVIPAVPPVIVVPGMPPVPPPAAGTSQTIVFVQAPTAPAAPMPEPRRQVEFVPVRRKPKRQTGLLAIVSGLTGIAAGVAAFRTEVVALAPAVAAAGFALGFFALFRSVFLSRTTFRAPMIGMAICFVAYVLAANTNRRLQSDYDHLRGWTGGRLPVLGLARFEPEMRPVPAPAPAEIAPAASHSAATVSNPTGSANAPKSSPAVVGTPAPLPSAPPANRGNLSFLDPNSGGWIDMSKGKPTSPAGTATAAISPVAQTPAPPPAPTPAPTVDLATAEQDLANARAAAAARMNLDYAGALKDVDTASTAYDTASRADSLGSPELAAASQRKIDAKAKVIQLQAQMETDPAVAAAEREVRAAKGK